MNFIEWKRTAKHLDVLTEDVSDVYGYDMATGKDDAGNDYVGHIAYSGNGYIDKQPDGRYFLILSRACIVSDDLEMLEWRLWDEHCKCEV